MTTISDLKITPLSGLNHIDALLDTGPDWNYLAGGQNTVSYTFSTASGIQTGASTEADFTGPVSTFNATQQAAARTALAYLTAITGIEFVETQTGTAAQLHFASANLTGASTTGLCSWEAKWSEFPDGTVVDYRPQAWVYLDNVEFAAENSDPSSGTSGYETLLHELGHAFGLKHPFQGDITLPPFEDSTQYTLMSYDHEGGTHAALRPYDIAALNWLYGGDGLGGTLGINSTGGGRYITGTVGTDTLTGTSSNDTLQGNGGNDMLNGGEGTDTAVFSGARAAYTFNLNGAAMSVTGADGTDTLTSIEMLQFSDGKFSRAELPDTTAPTQPTVAVARNAGGYVSGNKPVLFGIAEAGSTVKIFHGATQIATAVADASGFYNATASVLLDGSYSVHATATDASGNVSAQSQPFSFNIDVTAPVAPTASVGTVSNNQPAFTGTAEAGSTVYLVHDVNNTHVVIGSATASNSGTWSITTNPLANGAYSVTTESVDGAGNTTRSVAAQAITVDSSLNRTGTSNNDTLTGTSGNNAFDGGAGIDTVGFSGARSGFTIAKENNAFTVKSAASGTDAMYNVERLQFSDTSVALDIEGFGGQAYRLYRAAIDRVPDKGGLGFWMSALDKGVSANDIALGFITSEEFTTKYGANLSNTQFVTTLYSNVLHRGPDGAGFDFWVNALANGVSRAEVLTHFSESGENKLQVIGEIQNGFEYTLYTG